MRLPLQWPSIPTSVLIGIALRIVAAVFSQGYAMHDDHFVIEDGPWQWFLPNSGGWFARDTPPGHSVVYPAILYSILWLCSLVGVADPQSQMLVMRLIHAGFATLAIPLSAAIARRVGSPHAARTAAFLVAVFWILPFLSVRNLIEVVCIPPLLAGVLLLLNKKYTRHLVFAGIAFAVAFIFRYQTAVIPITLACVLLYQRSVRSAVILTVSSLIAVSLTQGLVDLVVWGTFMAAPYQYILGSIVDSDAYSGSNVMMYIFLLIGILIPPSSLLFAWNVVRDRRADFVQFIVLPLSAFVVAHTLIGNRQERFIIPSIPLVLIAVAVAWSGRRKTGGPLSLLWRASWVWFWIANTALLALFTFSYSKRSRVESLTVLAKQPHVERVAVVTRDGVFVPAFYLGKRPPVLVVSTDTTSAGWLQLSSFRPSHAVFYDNETLDVLKPRVERIIGGRLDTIAVVRPGLLDATLYRLNPRGNRNETSVVYKIEYSLLP